MARNATDQAFEAILKIEGRDYVYDGGSGRGLPSGIEAIQHNDLEATDSKAELIRVPRSAWSPVPQPGKLLTDNGRARRILDTDDDGTSRTLLLIVSLDSTE